MLASASKSKQLLADNDNVNVNDNVNDNNKINISNKLDTEQSSDSKKEITLKIDSLISLIKGKCDEYQLPYDKSRDRQFAKHILTAKEFWENCKKYGKTREDMSIWIITLSLDHRKWPVSWPKSIYQNYVDIMASYFASKKKKEMNSKIWFIPSV